MHWHLSNLPPKKGWVTYEVVPLVTAHGHTGLRRNGCRCVRECGDVGLLTGAY